MLASAWLLQNVITSREKTYQFYRKVANFKIFTTKKQPIIITTCWVRAMTILTHSQVETFLPQNNCIIQCAMKQYKLILINFFMYVFIYWFIYFLLAYFGTLIFFCIVYVQIHLLLVMSHKMVTSHKIMKFSLFLLHLVSLQLLAVEPFIYSLPIISECTTITWNTSFYLLFILLLLITIIIIINNSSSSSSSSTNQVLTFLFPACVCV